MLINRFRVAFFILMLLFVMPVSLYAADPATMEITGTEMDEEDRAIMEEMKKQKGSRLEKKDGDDDEVVLKEIPPFKMISIKGGCFDMGDTTGNGDPDERPVHEVCITGYTIGETEVTQGLWEAVMGFNPMPDPDVDKPVGRITWFWANMFMETLNKRTGKFYRIPTEAEWEFAARGGGGNLIWSGTSDENKLKEYAWFEDNSGVKLSKVKQLKPNSLGLYDMSGNLWEWVEDNFGFDYYKESEVDDPYGLEESNWKVIRGGSYSDRPFKMRSTYRHAYEPVRTSSDLGFRMAE